MKPKVGRNLTSERGEGVKGELKNISLYWLQGIFETVPYALTGTKFSIEVSNNYIYLYIFRKKSVILLVHCWSCAPASGNPPSLDGGGEEGTDLGYNIGLYV